MESVLTELGIWVDSKVKWSEEKLMIITIAPPKRESYGIPLELHMKVLRSSEKTVHLV